MKRAFTLIADRRVLVVAFLLAVAAGTGGCSKPEPGVHTCADADQDGLCDDGEACPPPATDADLDAVCDAADACPGQDDRDDFDADGVPDGCDACPADPFDDSDGDGTCDGDDACPAGDDRVNLDGDALADACDACPADAPDDADGDGVCTSVDVCAGHDDRDDFDGDGVADGCDACPADALGDSDGDGTCDGADACPGGDDRVDLDGDAVADACDPCPADAPDDADGDGVCTSVDACAGHDDRDDFDGDGVADGCDACPADALGDSDGDGTCDGADACPGGDDRVDLDGDAVADACDPCPADAPDDADGDGVCTSVDACAGHDDRFDLDSDGVADACDTCPFDATGDTDGDGACDGVDACPLDAPDDANGDGYCDSAVASGLLVNAVSPAAGAANGGYLVNVVGAGFLPGATVEFGSEADGWVASGDVTVLNSGTLAVALVPPHAAGLVDVRVTNTDLRKGVGAGVFTYQAPASLPALAFGSLSRTRGPEAGGYAVIVSGQGFAPGTTVEWGSQSTSTWTPSAAVECLGPTLLRTTVPAAATPGPVDVRITVPDFPAARSVVAPGAFTYGQSAVFQTKGQRLPGDVSLDDRQALLFDANRDGRTDVLVLHDSVRRDDLLLDVRDASGIAGPFLDATPTAMPDVPATRVGGLFGTWYVYLANRRWPQVVDLEGDGDPDVVFMGTAYSHVGVYRNGGAGAFTIEDRGWFDVSAATSMELGDLNCDGKADLFVTRNGYPSRILVGDGTGAFAAAAATVLPAIADASQAAALGDVDGDGDLDVVVANGSSQQTRLYYNNCSVAGPTPPAWAFADALYGAAGNFPISGQEARDVSLADLDADGDLDVLLVSRGQRTRVYLNTGAGSFVDGGLRFPATEANQNAAWAGVADVDLDGDADVVVAKDQGSGTLWPSIYLNDGTATFTAADANVPAWRGEAVAAFALGELSGDGLPDLYAVRPDQLDLLLVNHGYSPNLAIEANRVAVGTFADNTLVGLPMDLYTTTGCATGDVDRDGDVDILASSNWPGGLRLWLNDGAANFADATGTRLPDADCNGGRPSLVDVNGDGDLDIVAVCSYRSASPTGKGGLRQLANDGDGSFTNVTSADVPNNNVSNDLVDGAVADLNGDGRPDWVAVAGGTLGYTLANGGDTLGNDGAAFTLRNDWLGFGTSLSRTGVVLADLNGDGFTDAFVSVSGQNQLWHNDGTGVMTNVTGTHLPAASYDARHARAADFDRDGNVDLLVAVNGGSKLLLGTAGHTFADVTLTHLPAGLTANSVDAVVEDFDGDGVVDAYLTNVAAQDFLWLNNGAGVLADFSAALPREMDGSYCACAGDFDGNGRTDLFVGAADVDRVLLNQTP